VVETADFRHHDDGPDRCLSGQSSVRSVLFKPEVRPAAVIVVKVRPEDAPQMGLVRDDDVIETLPSDRADHALDVRILPGTRRRGQDLRDAHARQSALEGHAVDPSRSRWIQRGAVSSGKASTTCCAAHSAVGCAVVLIWRMRRRWWESTTTTKSTRPVSVETVKKSIAAAEAR
jgi:hypothetical protein